MKRITLRLSVIVPDEATLGDMTARFGAPTGNLHLENETIPADKNQDRIILNGECLSYGTIF